MKKAIQTIKYSLKAKILLGLLAIAAVAAFGYSQNKQPEVVQAASAPVVYVQFGDEQDSTPHLPSGCNAHLANMGPSTTDSDDPDCLRLQLMNSGPYTEDFRFCLVHSSGVESCSPWASSEPGFDPSNYGPVVVTNGGIGHMAGTMTARIDTRSLAAAGLPAGTTFNDVSVGAALFEKTGGNPHCINNIYFPSLKWTHPLANPSPWAYGHPNDDDPGCFQAGMFATMQAPPDAEYVSTTIPTNPTELVAGQQYNNNYQIVMRNKGMIWDAETVSTPSNNCQASLAPGQSCTNSRTLTSNRWKLQLVDDDGVQIRHNNNPLNEGGTIPFFVTQTMRHTRNVGIHNCDFSYLTPTRSIGMAASLKNLFVKSANAAPPPLGDDDPPCAPIPYDYVYTEYLSIDPNTGIAWDANITPNETATFKNVNFTAPNAPGLYDMEFRMVDMNNLSNNTPPYQNGKFGTSGIITIKVGGVIEPPPITLNCPATQTWYYGDPTPVPYAISATNGNGVINITMTSSPAGPVMTNSPLVLSAPNYAGTALVNPNNAPVGDYTLTFNNDRNIVPTCSAQLRIRANTPTVDVKFNGQDSFQGQQPVNGKVNWRVTNATSCDATASPNIAETSSWHGKNMPSQLPFVRMHPEGENVGPLTVQPPNGSRLYTFSLQCTGPGGNASDQVQVNVFREDDPPPPLPTADLKCKGNGDVSSSDGPCRASFGSSGMLAWTSTNATVCQLTDMGNRLDPNGSAMTGPLTANKTFTLVCRNTDTGLQSPPDSVTFLVANEPPPPVTAELWCDQNGVQSKACTVLRGGTKRLTWTSNGTSCTIDNNFPRGEGLRPSGNGLTNPINQNTTFTLVCRRDGIESRPSRVTITLQDVPPPPSNFTVQCSPPQHNVDEGNGHVDFPIVITRTNYNRNITFSASFDNTDPFPRPAVGFINSNPNLAIGRAIYNNTPAGLYHITFTGRGDDGRTATTSCNLNIRRIVPPSQPTVTADSLTSCEKVYIDWGPGRGGPAPTRYDLYRGRPETGTLLGSFAAGQDANGAEPGKYTDTFQAGARESDNYYYVIAYVGNIRSAAGTAGPANIRRCEPDLSNSDKDIVRVAGKFQQSFTPTPCTGSGPDGQTIVKLPGGAIFSVGDVITFEIHVCNDRRAEAAATNVEVKDLLYNPNNPDTQFHLINPTVLPGSGCANLVRQSANTLDFVVPRVEIGGVCTIRFTAEIKKPDNAVSRVYRFQNTGDIIVPSLPVGNPRRVTHYYTLPQLFSLSGGVPERNETAPQL